MLILVILKTCGIDDDTDMAKFKYVKRGVKRKHNIIEDILPMLENIANIDGVKKVTPASISYSPTKGIKGISYVKIQRDTVSGFKLLAHGKGSIQEIFVVVEGSKKEYVRNKLKEILHDNQ